MTRIDFYELDGTRHAFDQVVCQICAKAWDRRQPTLLLTASPEQSHHLDQRLWTFADDSFVPHDIDDSEDFVTPILIQDRPDPRGDRQLLINLSESVPEFFARFERVIEFVTDDNRTPARERYSYYKERGYPLRHVRL